MEKYCKNCGFILDEKKELCDYCGVKIKTSTITDSIIIEKKQTKSNSEDILVPLILYGSCTKNTFVEWELASTILCSSREANLA